MIKKKGLKQKVKQYNPEKWIYLKKVKILIFVKKNLTKSMLVKTILKKDKEDQILWRNTVRMLQIKEDKL